MSLPRPDATITIDGRDLRAREAAVAAVHVELGLGGALDAATLVLSGLTPELDLGPGATIEISLDGGTGGEQVFTGAVSDVQHTPWGMVVAALTDAAVLCDVRLGRAYVSQTAGDVATDLVQAGGARPGTIDAPLDLPAYLVTERRSVWRTLQDLARLSGSVLRSQADGSVDFMPVRSGVADHRVRAGAELLAWRAGSAGSVAVPPAVVPSGAASEAGSSRWQMLLAEPDGGPPSDATLVPMAIRSRDAAQSVHAALDAAAKRREATGVVVTLGATAVRAGDLLDVTDLPHGPDRTWRVLEVHHVLDPAGLRSRLRLEAA